MRRHSAAALSLLVGCIPALVAWRGASDPLVLGPQSRLWIDGKSTVRRFSCRATAFDAEVDAAPGAVAGALAAEKAVRTVVLRVPAAQLKCGNRTMNEHMLKALKAKDVPTIEFRLVGYDVGREATGVHGTLQGTLSLGGQTHAIQIAAQATEAGGGALHVSGAVPVRMTDYGLKPPTLMMGTLRVDDVVTVRFDLFLMPPSVAGTN